MSASNTLCWRCKNAVPNMEKTCGCSWSRDFIPVESWEAIETSIYCQRWDNRTKTRDASIGTKSYIVISCPEFVPDGREEKE